MEKKQKGSGSIKKLPSGTWRGQIMDGYRPDGKRNIVSFTALTEEEVQNKIQNYWIKNGKASGTVHVSIHTPFDQWADIWYEDYRTQVQSSTYCNYKYTLRILKDYFGEKAIGEIKPWMQTGSMTICVQHLYPSPILRNAAPC